MVLFVLLLSGMAWALFALTDLARQAQKQTEIQHVADHTAHALAVLAARDLNFKAITNRAMLANEVAIGQLHALLSWFEMAREMSLRTALYSAWIPYVNQVTAALARMMQRIQPGLTQGTRALVRFQQFVLDGLQHAQWTFHQATWLTSVSTAQVIANESHLEAELFLLNHQTLIDLHYLWFRFQSRVSDEQAAAGYAHMAALSRDGFTKERTYRWFDAGFIYAQKAGGAKPVLRDRQMHWQSVDTLSFHERGLLFNWEHRFGAGGSFLTHRPPITGRPAGFGASYQRNPRASRAAARRAVPVGASHRIPHYYQIAQTDKPSPSITVVVRVPQSNLASERVPIWAAARSEVFYERPSSLWPRVDGNRERANLWNGLWQARNSTLSPFERRLLGLQVHRGLHSTSGGFRA